MWLPEFGLQVKTPTWICHGLVKPMVTGDASHEIPGFSRLKKQHLQTGYRIPHLPSGKRLRNYGKPPFLMGKSTINGNFQ
jgi:hypothetical protein